jgi:hypothetical protein
MLFAGSKHKRRNKRRKREDGAEDVPYEEDGYEESEDEEIIDYDEQGRPIRKRTSLQFHVAMK